MKPAITLFGSYRPQPGDELYELAESIGYQLAVAGFDLINGGHEGTMAASAAGARRGGGRAIGVTCRSVREARDGAVNEFITDMIEAPDLLRRIETMMRRAAGYVILSGGTGTLAELGLIWEHVSKGVLSPRPICCVGDCWRSTVAAVETNDPAAARLIRFVNDAERVVAIMRESSASPPESDRDFLPPGTSLVQVDKH